MAYIGNQPAESFTSFATQEFSTSATTSYTLNHAVTNENEIALFVNNVRQQPGSGKAYTATGTALTLSAATASTDTMYCVFLGRALQTVVPATNSITNAMVNSSAAIATTKLGAGAVLQVVSGTTSTAVTSTSSTFADTGLTANITPSSTSNKVLVLIDQLIFLDENSASVEIAAQLKVLRDSTDIFTTPNVNDLRLTAEHAPNNELRLGQRLGLSILDSPSTTSQITYKTQFNKTAGAQTIANRSSSEARIILMEVSG